MKIHAINLQEAKKKFSAEMKIRDRNGIKNCTRIEARKNKRKKFQKDKFQNKLATSQK